MVFDGVRCLASLQEAYLLFDLTGLRLGSLASATLSLEVWGGQRGNEGLRPGHMEDLPLRVAVVEAEAAAGAIPCVV